MSAVRAAGFSFIVVGLLYFSPHAPAQTIVAGASPGSFRVTETGAATYSIPIPVPPGIGGIEPKLALAYSSQGRNGLLGLGWSLGGFSAVHRCGRTMVQDGASLGVSYDGGDRYCIDGQRLVAVSGAYGADGTEYRTERESFTRIISYSAAGTGPAYFKAWTKSGQVIEYGNTADSRIEAQGKADVRIYAVNRISDSVGNYLTWTYAEDNANGDFFPTRIDYTGNSATGALPFASVRLSYQPRSDTPPLYVGGSAVKTMNRLTNVRTYFGEIAIKDYRLAYDNGGSSSTSRLLSVTECSGDGTQCLNPISLSWQASSGTTGFTGPSNWGQPAGVYIPFGSPRAFIADANRDGLGDLFYSSGQTVVISYSTGGGLSGPGTLIAGAPSGCDRGDPGGPCTMDSYLIYAVGDVNGDGYADVVTGIGEVFVSTGGGFAYAGNWGVTFGDSHFQFLVDVNGDGLADLVYGSGTSIYVRYSTGSGFSGASFIASDGSGCMRLGEAGCEYVPYAVFAAGDLNGDGRADVITGSGDVYVSTPGGGFSYAGNWGVTFPLAQIADANGDGLNDLIYSSSVGGGLVLVAYSNGAGFSGGAVVAGDSTGCAQTETGMYCRTFVAYLAAGDMNGDGLADVFTGQINMVAATVSSPDLLAQITDSLGAALSFTYAPLANGSVYTPEGGSGWPVRDLRPGIPMYLAASASSIDGAGGAYTVNHRYIGGRVRMLGGGFLGFRRIESTDTRTGLKTSAEFRQDYPFQGLPTLAEKTQSSGALLNRATNGWTDALFPNGTGKYHRSDLTSAVESGNDLNGAALPTVSSSTSYDGYGNALTVAVSTGDGYTRTTTSAYTNDTTRWFLGRLSSSQVANATPNAGSQTRSSAFAYDVNTGLLTKEMIEPDNSNLCVVTEYQYDSYGNRSSATTRNCNGLAGEAPAPTGTAVFQARTSLTYFDTSAGCSAPPNYVQGRFPVRRVNAKGQAECLEADYRFGGPTKLTGPNGLATTWSYDLFGRKTAENRADGTTTSWSYVVCGAGCPSGGSYSLTAAATGAPTSTAYFDILNRAFRTETQGFDGTLVRKDTQFDNMGQVSAVSQPYFATQTPVWTTFTYDVLGRVLTQKDPSNSVTTTAYNGLSTTVTNALNQSQTSVKNSQGQLISVTRQ